MPDDFNKNTSIEDEIEKSLQKMVEEETTVAKAYVGNADDYKAEQPSDINDGKTRVVPKITDEILKEQQVINKSSQPTQEELTDRDILLDDDEDEDKEILKDATKKPLDKKTKLIIAGVAAGVALVLIIIIIVAVSLNKKSKNNYDYYYQTGMKLYEEGNYGDASSYLSKASKENEGKKNLNLKYTLYRCYESSGNEDEAVNVLKDILSYDENYEDAVKALADIYYKKEDADNLTKLIRKYQDGKCSNAVKNYIVKEPSASKEPGSYDDDVELKFTCDSGCVVYYTTDGKEPDIKSTLYDGTAIKLETGTTKIKAVSVNSIGVYSKVVEFEYVVEYGAPAAPDVTPASGKYSDGEKIKINNIPDKCKAYYTTDGTTPTSSSVNDEIIFGLYSSDEEAPIVYDPTITNGYVEVEGEATTEESTGNTGTSIDFGEVTLLGDTNRDDVIDSTDIVVLNKYLLNKVQYPLQDSSAYANGDCDKDKDLTTKDSLFIIQHVLGIELLN